MKASPDRMEFQARRVALSQVDSGDRRYRISTETATADLRASIDNLGLLSSPLLEETDSGFAVVNGFRRISACRDLGWDRIPAQIVDPAVPEVIRLKSAITENALQRSLNLVEQARSLEKLSRFYGDAAELARQASSLGLPGNTHLIGKLLEISRLSWPIQAALLTGSVFLPTALELGKLEKDSAMAFVRLFEELRPGLNRQREILALIWEIAMREDIPVMDVLNDKPVRNMLTPEDPDRPLKVRRLLDYLKKRRFPRISEAEETFNDLTRGLHLGSDVSLIPPEGFEGTEYVLTFRFADLAQLKKQREKLDRIIGDPAFGSYFR